MFAFSARLGPKRLLPVQEGTLDLCFQCKGGPSMSVFSAIEGPNVFFQCRREPPTFLVSDTWGLRVLRRGPCVYAFSTDFEALVETPSSF
jgi:hypothetical protein